MTEEDTQRHEIVTPAPVDIRSMRDDKVCHEKMKEINLFSCYDFELGDKHKVSGMDTQPELEEVNDAPVRGEKLKEIFVWI